jgi:hypothetical protein
LSLELDRRLPGRSVVGRANLPSKILKRAYLSCARNHRATERPK